MNALEWRAVIGLGLIYALRMLGLKFKMHDPRGLLAKPVRNIQ